MLDFPLIMFLHFWADFVCQSDEVAKNKSKSNAVLAYHCLIYAFYTTFGFIHEPIQLWPLIFLILFSSHFLTDYVTSRINSHYWSTGQVHNFFVGIGADQFIHFLVLYLLWYYSLILNL